MRFDSEPTANPSEPSLHDESPETLGEALSRNHEEEDTTEQSNPPHDGREGDVFLLGGCCLEWTDIEHRALSVVTDSSIEQHDNSKCHEDETEDSHSSSPVCRGRRSGNPPTLNDAEQHDNDRDDQ